MTIWTVGHSNVPVETLLARLQGHGIELVADVRRFPASRRHPQFNRDALAAALGGAGIDYVHVPELGGRRPPRKDSPHTAWRHPSFRGYADYMDTPAFADGMARLLEAGANRRVAVLCAEQLWWQCHRGLIADRLKADGHDVRHIADAAKAEPHPFTSAARLVNGRLDYSAPLLP